MSKVTPCYFDSNAAKVWRHRQRTLYGGTAWDTVVAAVDAALADGRVYWPSGKAAHAGEPRKTLTRCLGFSWSTGSARGGAPESPPPILSPTLAAVRRF